MILILGAWTGYIIAGFVILFVIAIAAAVAVLQKKNAAPESSPYVVCPLLTPAERSFWQVLQQCLPEGHVLLVKVRLADIINVKKGFDPKTQQGHFNRISRKHADFILCDVAQMMPRVVIELDDASHQTRKASQRDEQKNTIVESAGIRLLRVRAERNYNTAQLRESLASAVASVNPAQSIAADVDVETSASPTNEPEGSLAQPTCPLCGNAMVLRVAKQGASKGSEFWGCSRYPHCKGILKPG